MSVPYHYVAIYKYNQNRMARIGIWISNLMILGTKDQSGIQNEVPQRLFRPYADTEYTSSGQINGFRPDAAPRTYPIPSSQVVSHCCSTHQIIYIYGPNRQFLIIRCVRFVDVTSYTKLCFDKPCFDHH